MVEPQVNPFEPQVKSEMQMHLRANHGATGQMDVLGIRAKTVEILLLYGRGNAIVVWLTRDKRSAKCHLLYYLKTKVCGYFSDPRY